MKPVTRTSSVDEGSPHRAPCSLPAEAGRGGRFVVAAVAAGCFAVMAGAAYAVEAGGGDARGVTGQFLRVLLLRDYNTRVVLAGTSVLGAAAGAVGTLLLLRQRALLGDTLAHATLPGIALAFLLTTMTGAAGAGGKSLPLLLGGAVVSAALFGGAVLALRHGTRLKEDAALGIVLSVSFGLGVALLGIAQKMPAAQAAGLESFIYGKTASMLASDVKLIVIAALGALAVTAGLLKEWRLLCFDQSFAASLGRSIMPLDLLMVSLAVVVTVVGLQAVGLILITALLIIPAAAARFWTRRMHTMLALAAVFGALSGLAGAAISALAARLPSGAIIVLVAAGVFVFSMLFAPHRGVLIRAWRRRRMRRGLARASPSHAHTP